MANFFEQFHDQPPEAGPAGDVSPSNYFSRFHSDPPVDRGTAGAPSTVLTVRPKAPDAGMNDAAKRGLMQGVTGNWDDELQAVAKAGGATDDYNGVQHLIAGLARLATGNEDAHRIYNEEVTKNREAEKAASENHPYVHGAADAVGTLLTLPVGGELLGGAKAVAAGAEAAPQIAKTFGQVAKEVAGRAGTAAKQGAIYGGVTGAGEGEGVEGKAIQGTAGGVLGGILGGVAQPVLEGAGALISKGTDGVRNAVRGAFNTEGEAGRRYLTALEHDIKADPTAISRMTPQEFADNPDARLMDLGGGLVKRLADSANITSPAGGLKMKQAIDNRFEGQTNRFSDWFRSHFNYPDAFHQKQMLDEVSKTVNGPNYAKAYAEGSKGVWSPELERLTGAPSIQEALMGAVKPLKDRGIVAGYKLPRENPFVNNPANPGTITLRTNKQGNTIVPELAYWDQAARNLGGRIGELQRAGNDTRARDLTMLKQDLLKELDSKVSSYKAARQGAAGFFGAENAVEAGQKFVMSDSIGVSEARQALSNMTPTERKLFADGFVSDFIDKVINKTGDRRNVLDKIAANPKAKEKLELVMGHGKYRELEAKLRVEGIYDDVRKAVQGNSWTAKRLYDLGLAGGAFEGAHGAYDMDPKELATGAIISAIASGGKHVNTQVATKLAEMLISRDPAVVQKGFKYLSGNSAWMDALRAADGKIGRLISQAAPTNAAPQLMGVSRADDKPGVPRPPGQ